MPAAAASLYLSAPACAPPTLPTPCNCCGRRCDEELERLLADTQRRLQRENAAVFLQPLPGEVPPLPEGKRLVAALPYALPPPAAVVADGVVERGFAAGPAAAGGPAGDAALAPAAPTAAVGVSAAAAAGDSSGKPVAAAAAAGGAAGGEAAGQGGGGCSCWRWMAFAVAAPLLAILWVVGAVIWVLLLPFKCCCPCIAIPLQLAVDLMLWLMGALPRWLWWAAGGSGGDGGKEAAAAKEKK